LLRFLPFWTAGTGRYGSAPDVVRWASGEPVALSLRLKMPLDSPL
jgi:hypothetical protein